MASPPSKKARIGDNHQGGTLTSNAPVVADQATQTPRTCTQCSKLFDPASNPPGSCVRHTGTLDVDNDHEAWDDHWESDGPITAELFFDDFPEAFIWDCCEKPGTEPGCEQDVHRSTVEKIM